MTKIITTNNSPGMLYTFIKHPEILLKDINEGTYSKVEAEGLSEFLISVYQSKDINYDDKLILDFIGNLIKAAKNPNVLSALGIAEHYYLDKQTNPIKQNIILYDVIGKPDGKPYFFAGKGILIQGYNFPINIKQTVLVYGIGGKEDEFKKLLNNTVVADEIKSFDATKEFEVKLPEGRLIVDEIGLDTNALNTVFTAATQHGLFAQFNNRIKLAYTHIKQQQSAEQLLTNSFYQPANETGKTPLSGRAGVKSPHSSRFL